MRRYAICVSVAISLLAVHAITARAAIGFEHAARVVGLGRDGETAMEFIGRVDQNGENFTFIGYLTRVKGLDEVSLFADGDPAARTEKTARFTFSAQTTLTSRSKVQNVFAVDSTGKLDIFFDETPSGSADFTDPTSFSQGDLVASFSIRFQNSISVIAPAQGVSKGWGVLTQIEAGHFRLDGRRVQFGHTGQRQRALTAGQGTLQNPPNPATPISVIFITGNTVGLE